MLVLIGDVWLDEEAVAIVVLEELKTALSLSLDWSITAHPVPTWVGAPAR